MVFLWICFDAGKKSIVITSVLVRLGGIPRSSQWRVYVTITFSETQSPWEASPKPPGEKCLDSNVHGRSPFAMGIHNAITEARPRRLHACNRQPLSL